MKKPKNEICEGCLKWKQFQDGCRVYWEGKKECTMRVLSQEEWDDEVRVLKG